MRIRLTLLTFILLPVFFIQCQKEVRDPGNIDPGIPAPSPITVNLQGNVYNENNLPASGVKIKVGSKSAITNHQGFFRIPDAPLDKKSTLVTAEKNGYFKTYRVFSATSGTNHIEFKLTKKLLTGTIDATMGGEVVLTNGAKVQLPSNGVMVASSGVAYTGTVNVYVAYIDPSDPEIDRSVPGSFLANNASNNRVILQSFGMMAVELSSPSGEKLQIKTGASSKLIMPIPASLQASAPASIPLWYVDEQTGIWKEEGAATRNGNLYSGDVKHYTFWNCDVAFSTVPISFTIKNAAGFPVVHASVKIVRASAPGQPMVYGYTDSLGQGNPSVAANEALIMNVYDPCGVIVYTQNLGPYNQATDLGVISLPASVNKVITLTGQLKNCSGGPVTHGWAILNYENVNRLAAVNSNGEFNLSFIACANGSSAASFAAVDLTNNQQGSTQNISITQPVTNIGVYNACGVSSQEYMNYILDGVNYSIPNTLAVDTIFAWSKLIQGTTTWETYFSGSCSINGYYFCTFKFQSPSLIAGSYPLTSLIVGGYTAVNLLITGNVTTIAQAPTEFYEGNFSGSFIDLNGNPHTIMCNFRIRRMF